MYEKWNKSFRNCWVWQRRKLVHLMRLARTKICRNKWINKRSCYTPRCKESESYGLFSPKRTTVTTEVFARNESDETLFSNFYYKWALRNGEAVCSKAYMPGIENRICCCYCKRFSSGCAVALHSIPPERKYFSNSWIDYSVVGWNLLERWNWGQAQDLAPSYQRFQPLWLDDLSKISAYGIEWGPALAKAGPG